MTDYYIIEEFIGKTLASVDVNEAQDEVLFVFTDTTKYKMYHHQDCCESVNIEDIEGDLGDLIGLPLVTAEAASEDCERGEYDDSSTWTFYRLGTAKGMIVMRWLGSSNGYYSESVDIDQVK